MGAPTIKRLAPLIRARLPLMEDRDLYYLNLSDWLFYDSIRRVVALSIARKCCDRKRLRCVANDSNRCPPATIQNRGYNYLRRSQGQFSAAFDQLQAELKEHLRV